MPCNCCMQLNEMKRNVCFVWYGMAQTTASSESESKSDNKSCEKHRVRTTDIINIIYASMYCTLHVSCLLCTVYKLCYFPHMNSIRIQLNA